MPNNKTLVLSLNFKKYIKILVVSSSIFINLIKYLYSVLYGAMIQNMFHTYLFLYSTSEDSNNDI